jgi:hypothetical protein
MKSLFTVTVIVELIFGLGFVATPDLLIGTFGVNLSGFSITLGRMFGSALLGFVTLLWYARNSSSSDLHKAALRGMFVYWLVSTVVMIPAQLAGLVNTMGWSVIVLHLGFLIAYGVFAFRR